MDLVLHADRLDGRAKRTYEARLGELPDGVIVERGGRGVAWLAGGALRPWTAAGYGAAERAARGRAVTVLTPAVTVAAIAARLRARAAPVRDLTSAFVRAADTLWCRRSSLTRLPRRASAQVKGGGATMMRFICQKCLRLWDGEQVSHTASCPYCGGGLNAR